MATKRMISKIVAHNSKFLRMKAQSKLLYVFSCLEADDKGVISSIDIALHNANAKIEHLNELVENGFLIELKEDVYVVTHWYTQNQIDKRMEQESFYIQDLQNSFCIDEKGVYHKKENCKNTQNICEVSRTPRKNQQKTSEESFADPENQRKTSRKSKKNEKVATVSIGKDSIGKDSIDQNNNTHTTQGENTETVCADVCVHDESCDQTSCSCQTNTPSVIPDPPSNPPESAIADPPSDPLGDITSNIASDPPDDFDYSPDDDIDDAFEYSKELTAKAEEIRKRLKAAGLGVPDEITWQMRDFKFALEGKRRLHLSDDEFFGALENYAVLLEAKQANPDLYWWKSKPPIGSLFNDGGKGPPINWLLPYAFDLNNFKKGDGNASAPSRRGIDSVSYDASEIAERQAVAVPVYDDASYDDLPY